MTTNVLIAVQARSTSTRLPGKWRVMINGHTVMDRVIAAVQSSAHYMNNGKGDIKAQTCLVVPFGDELAKKYGHRMSVIEGSESDVLERYHQAAETMGCDYIVRITGDCSEIPAFVITKHVIKAVDHNFDYMTNTFEDARTCPDGHDVEVISRKLLDHCHKHATTEYDREHVTTFIKREMPHWATVGETVGYTDDSHLKISIDTMEDVEFVRTYDVLLNRKIANVKRRGSGLFRI